MCTEIHTPERWYERQFARYYDRMMRQAEIQVLGNRRMELLAQCRGPVLEIGCGTGVNFQYYSDGMQVLALDPSAAMLAYARQSSQTSPANINLMRLPAESINQIEGQFETVVCCLVLCTVKRPQAVLQLILDKLRPGGRLLVLEHIRSKHKFTAFLQTLIKPCWKCCGAGCVLNRATDCMLQNSAGLQMQSQAYFRHSLPFYQAEFERTTA